MKSFLASNWYLIYSFRVSLNWGFRRGCEGGVRIYFSFLNCGEYNFFFLDKNVLFLNKLTLIEVLYNYLSCCYSQSFKKSNSYIIIKKSNLNKTRWVLLPFSPQKPLRYSHGSKPLSNLIFPSTFFYLNENVALI